MRTLRHSNRRPSETQASLALQFLSEELPLWREQGYQPSNLDMECVRELIERDCGIANRGSSNPWTRRETFRVNVVRLAYEEILASSLPYALIISNPAPPTHIIHDTPDLKSVVKRRSSPALESLLDKCANTVQQYMGSGSGTNITLNRGLPIYRSGVSYRAALAVYISSPNRRWLVVGAVCLSLPWSTALSTCRIHATMPSSLYDSTPRTRKGRDALQSRSH